MFKWLKHLFKKEETVLPPLPIPKRHHQHTQEHSKVILTHQYALPPRDLNQPQSGYHSSYAPVHSNRKTMADNDDGDLVTGLVVAGIASSLLSDSGSSSIDTGNDSFSGKGGDFGGGGADNSW